MNLEAITANTNSVQWEAYLAPPTLSVDLYSKTRLVVVRTEYVFHIVLKFSVAVFPKTIHNILHNVVKQIAIQTMVEMVVVLVKKYAFVQRIVPVEILMVALSPKVVMAVVAVVVTLQEIMVIANVVRTMTVLVK